MPGKGLGEGENPGASLKSEDRVRLASRGRREASVEAGKPFRRRRRRVALRQGGERRVQLRAEIKQAGDHAELYDVVTDGERSEEPRPLQRFGLVRQGFQSAIEAALPGFRPRREGADRQATQIAQGQGEEPARPQSR